MWRDSIANSFDDLFKETLEKIGLSGNFCVELQIPGGILTLFCSGTWVVFRKKIEFSISLFCGDDYGFGTPAWSPVHASTEWPGFMQILRAYTPICVSNLHKP